jgi:hypothetical protein
MGGVNLSWVVKGQRSPTARLVGGYLTGTFSIALGSLVLGGFKPDSLSVAVGASALGIGAFDIGATVWAHTLPGASNLPRVSLIPLLDRAGTLAGVGLQFTR